MATTVLFIAQTGDEKISMYQVDRSTGALEFLSASDAHGPVGPLCLHPSGKVVLAAHAGLTTLASFSLEGGSLSLINKVDTGIQAPAHLITDRKAQFLLTAYYSGGGITVHRLGEDGSVGEQMQHLQTGEKAHAVVASPDERFVFVPHVCPTNRTAQLCFDGQAGQLSANEPAELAPPDEYTGPRHMCFRPGEDVAYTVNEQGNSVTAHRFDAVTGRLDSFQNISTLPQGHQEESFTAHVEVHKSGRWAYATNRGHESIVGFDVAADGTLSQFGHYPVPASPRSFNIDPTGVFLYCAGEGADRMTAFRIDPDNGQLQPIQEYDVGRSPFWVMVVDLD